MIRTFEGYDAHRESFDIAKGSTDLMYPALGLAGETGEVAEKIKKIYRDKQGVLGPTDRDLIVLELGDVLWYLSAIAHRIGSTLEEVANKNVEKLTSRLARGTLKGNGDTR